MAKRILVVENAQPDRELLQLIFSTHGFEVDTAGDASEAMSQLRTRQPDLMVIDAVLPDESGWVFCEQVKQEGDHQRIPVMMLTESVTDEQTFETSCADDFMAKPFEDEQLLSRVRHLLR